mmetsp:Transcript_42365/g.83228  ORF Transcript_42365/g.83228 Transcript_42365/m.83228 type:complete len:285 (-) Transcript_42365:41-895(-)
MQGPPRALPRPRAQPPPRPHRPAGAVRGDRGVRPPGLPPLLLPRVLPPDGHDRCRPGVRTRVPLRHGVPVGPAGPGGGGGRGKSLLQIPLPRARRLLEADERLQAALHPERSPGTRPERGAGGRQVCRVHDHVRAAPRQDHPQVREADGGGLARQQRHLRRRRRVHHAHHAREPRRGGGDVLGGARLPRQRPRPGHGEGRKIQHLQQAARVRRLQRHGGQAAQVRAVPGRHLLRSGVSEVSLEEGRAQGAVRPKEEMSNTNHDTYSDRQEVFMVRIFIRTTIFC